VSDRLKRSFPFLPPEEAVTVRLQLLLLHKKKRFFVLPSVSGLGEDWLRSVDESDLALLVATFCKMMSSFQTKLQPQTAQRDMGISLCNSGASVASELPFNFGNTKRVIIHINNTNPVFE